MPIIRQPTPYPLIDSDPHFSRVVRYYRPSDYVIWGGLGLGGSALAWFSERTNPTFPRRGIWRGIYLVGATGLVGGFFYTYMRSSYRFFGWTENSREVKKDWAEMRAKAEQGEPLYGYTAVTEYQQGASMRATMGSQAVLYLLPIFNFANHRFHNTDQDYFAGIESKRPENYRMKFDGPLEGHSPLRVFLASDANQARATEKHAA